MGRGAKIGVVVVGLVVAGLVAWRLVRFRVLVAMAIDGSVSASSWAVIAAHADDPRAQRAAQLELKYAAAEDACKPYERLHDTAEPILAAHPTRDDESLASIVRILRQCADRRALRWTTRPTRDLVVQMHEQIADAHTDAAGLTIPILLQLAPPMDQVVVDVLVSSMGSRPGPADALLRRGLPPDGAKLVDAGAPVPRVDPRTDARLAAALRHWTLHAYAGLHEEQAQAMLRLLDWIAPPAIDPPWAERLGSNLARGPSVMKLCQALVRPETKALVARYASPAEATECFASLGTLGDAAAMLERLPEFQLGADEKARTAWAEEQAAILAKMGPKIAPALVKALSDPKLSVRVIAARAYAKIDRHAYAAAASRALRAGAPQGRLDAELAMSLVADGAPELDVYFASFAVPDAETTSHAATFLRQRVPPAEWVPPFFANLLVGTSFSRQTVDHFAWLLGDTDAVGAPTAAVLEKDLEAAGGKPEDVYWLTKMLAFRALAAKGTHAEVATAKKFLRDTTEYEEFETKKNDRGEVLEEHSVKRYIATLAADAVKEMERR